MKLAKIVFTVAGVWGVVVLTPLYFLLDVTGHQDAPPADYPHFFYGFLAVAMAWQIAVIGSQPGAIPAVDDPGHYRKARLRRDHSPAAEPGAHLSGGRDNCLARPAPWHPLHLCVLEDCAVDERGG